MQEGVHNERSIRADTAPTSAVGRQPWSARLRRRFWVWPLWTLVGGLTLGLLPLWLALALVHDLIWRRRFAALRLMLLVASLLALEAAGVLGAGVLGLIAPIDSARGQDLHRRLQSLWGRSVLGAGMRLMSMRLQTTGLEALGQGPLLILPRHTSLADSLLPTVLLSGPGGLNLRFVLKHELLLDPCLDLVGNRMPNAFVRRGIGGDAAARLLGDLAAGLGDADAVVIFPEGTRASDGRKRAAIATHEAAGDAEGAARIASFRQLLPPRLAGVDALLRAAPEADVAFLAHVGFDGVVSLRDMLSGKLIGRTVRVHVERVDRAEIPDESDARRVWLDERWRRMDAWVDAALRDEAHPARSSQNQGQIG